MFEVREGVGCVNGEVFQTFERDARDGHAHLEVEAGTTGFRGGGRQEGGRAYVRISAENADFFARIIEDDNKRPRGADQSRAANLTPRPHGPPMLCQATSWDTRRSR